VSGQMIPLLSSERVAEILSWFHTPVLILDDRVDLVMREADDPVAEQKLVSLLADLLAKHRRRTRPSSTATS